MRVLWAIALVPVIIILFFRSPSDDAVITSNFNGVHTCYILHGYSIHIDNNRLEWFKSDRYVNMLTKGVGVQFSSSTDYNYVYKNGRFTSDEIDAAIENLKIPNKSMCVEMK